MKMYPNQEQTNITGRLGTCEHCLQKSLTMQQYRSGKTRGHWCTVDSHSQWENCTPQQTVSQCISSNSKTRSVTN